ncbi:hypothetical protein TNCT_378991 [Trichonephila clavata]|uniref:Uncharacterized protein n=1 Tax=Trichonephila clavata TaxID=2740835 RepID=A0A8X6GQ34_TRICU|nr:hypothetical protein TNCT_378991 [Trichonephila clavata]
MYSNISRSALWLANFSLQQAELESLWKTTSTDIPQIFTLSRGRHRYWKNKTQDYRHRLTVTCVHTNEQQLLNYLDLCAFLSMSCSQQQKRSRLPHLTVN